MTNDLKEHLSNLLNETVTNVSSAHGGDISKAYRLDTTGNSYFLKINSSLNAFLMFQTETHGLRLIGNTNTIKTPKVIAYDTFENVSFLLMEFIESKSPSPKDLQNFGQQLAALHKSTSDYFGLNEDNFIGSLPQCNKQHKTWFDFYVSERLLPQLRLAKQKQLLSEKDCPSENQVSKTLEPLFKNIKPSLLHGDLWGGNYLISKDGSPYLIDPAVYYGHHEVDIAMSKLFGVFGEDFYNAYQSRIPQDLNTASRIEIYQLYYLLVHLNLFGRSYYGSVVSILKTYF